MVGPPFCDSWVVSHFRESATTPLMLSPSFWNFATDRLFPHSFTRNQYGIITPKNRGGVMRKSLKSASNYRVKWAEQRGFLRIVSIVVFIVHCLDVSFLLLRADNCREVRATTPNFMLNLVKNDVIASEPGCFENSVC